MKFGKNLQWLAVVAGVTIAIAPFTPQLAQAQSTQQMFPLLAGIELTQQQQAKLKDIRTQTLSQIDKILRPEQLTAFKSAMAQGQSMPQAIATLNLSSDQMKQLQQVLRSAQQRASGLLTSGQKQQLLQNLRSRGMEQLRNR